MLRAVIICPDNELGERLEDQLLEVGRVGIARRMDRYPTTLEVVRLLRAHAPDSIFLSIESLAKAMDVVSAIEANSPGVPVIAVHRVCDPHVLLELMRAGIREFLSLPFEINGLRQTIQRLEELVERKPPAVETTDLLFSFVPAKAGVGTSTIALNTAVALSRQNSMNVLLADFDLNSGMLRFMLKLDTPHSVIEACENAGRMDDQMWPRMVSSIGSLDVIHAGRLNPDVRLESPQIRHLLEFARRNYRAICIDLSGNLEKYSLEIMHESRQIFLVTTPEIPALHLAREKHSYLRSLDLADRVSLLLNRAQKRSTISPSQIEELLGAPVAATFHNDYQGVHKALSAGRPIDPGSDLGRQFAVLAKEISDVKSQAAQAEPRKRFIEYFSLLPAKYTVVQNVKKPAV